MSLFNYFHILSLICLLLTSFGASAESLSLNESHSDLLAEQKLQLFYADTAPVEAPQNPQRFIESLKPAAAIDRVDGGAYWLYLEVENISPIKEWVFDINNAVIDHITIFHYTPREIYRASSGYQGGMAFDLHYGIDLSLVPGETSELLVYIEGQYYSGMPRFALSPLNEYQQTVDIENRWIIGCLAAVLILAFYNLFIAFSMRDRSYFYYAVYLVFSIIAWAGAMNVLSDWFGWRSEYSLIPPFFLTITFNVLYYIHFLELKQSHPALTKISYGLVIFSAAMALGGLELMNIGQYQQVHAVSAGIWISCALIFGIIRLREGYKPARFFVAAFSVVFIGSLFSIAQSLGIKTPIQNAYLLTLVAQTIDMLLLSFALADRISLLRIEKESALERLVINEKNHLRTETEAREVLAIANETLLEALAISQKENENKSNFLRMVSHELRTPMHSITTALRQWDHSDTFEQQAAILEDINYGTARLRTQIDNLVLMAETDDEHLEAQSFPFELAPLLNKLIERAQEQVAEKDVEIIHHRSKFLPHGLQGDGYMLSHLVRTLLDNACKFTEAGEIVVDVDWNEETQSLDILIVDEGCGMSEAQQKVVFDGFIQVSQGLTRQSEGLGLGLTLCHRLSQILDASLEINSIQNQGTEINLHIPFKKLLAPVSKMPESDFRGSVLIVEDNLVNARVLERMVIKMGHPVDVAHSGMEALAAVEKRTYSVILMDVQMPDMDGITVTQQLRQQRITTPIIAVTANSDGDVRRNCRHAGMNDFLVKPVSTDDVEIALVTWQQSTNIPSNKGNLH